jgi:hypothetical protein
VARNTHLMHGLVVRSDIPLDNTRRVAAPPDLDLVTGLDRRVPLEPPPGTLLARRSQDGRPLYALTRHEKGHTLRFHGVCDMEISPGLDRARLHVDPTADRRLPAVLATGLLVSCVLVLRGQLVLHASAVTVGPVVVAFVGRSGQGKSTLAALAVAQGALLVTDDILRVDVLEDATVCRVGATASRLRPPLPDLGDRLQLRPRRMPDGRSALPLPVADGDALPLAAIVLPFRRPGLDGPVLTQLSRSAGLLALSACPRVLGWSDPRTRGEQFVALGRLAARVPVWQALVPQGPPFASDLARRLLADVGVPFLPQDALAEPVRR